jgi:hypothetical protein
VLAMGILILVVLKLLFRWKNLPVLFEKVQPPDAVVQIP